MNGCWYLISARSDIVAVCTCCSGLADFFIVQFPKIRSVVWFEHEVLGVQKPLRFSGSWKVHKQDFSDAACFESWLIWKSNRWNHLLQILLAEESQIYLEHIPFSGITSSFEPIWPFFFCFRPAVPQSLFHPESSQAAYGSRWFMRRHLALWLHHKH